jgi:hypothetical protein
MSHSLSNTAFIVFIMFSASPDSNPKSSLNFTCGHLEAIHPVYNPALPLVLKRDNHSGELQQCIIYVDIVGFANRLRLQFIPNQMSRRFLKLF